MDQIILDVIKAVGSQRKLASRLGISHQSITQWRQIPSTRAIEIEKITGISRHRLRPDVFGPPDTLAGHSGDG